MNEKQINESYERANEISLLEVTSPASSLRCWVVRQGRKDIGLLEKFKDDACTKNPWKAFLGVGYCIKFLGVSYVCKQDAIDMICRADKGLFIGTELARKS